MTAYESAKLEAEYIILNAELCPHAIVHLAKQFLLLSTRCEDLKADINSLRDNPAAAALMRLRGMA